MSTQGRGARVKNPTTKLTIDNLVKPVLSSHRENITAAKARKLLPTVSTSQSAQVSGTLSSTITAAPPSTPGPSITDVDAGQASSSALPAKRSFKATVVDADDEDEFNQSSNSDPAPVPGKGKQKQKRKKKRARTSGST
jgi:hypothetical protein